MHAAFSLHVLILRDAQIMSSKKKKIMKPPHSATSVPPCIWLNQLSNTTQQGYLPVISPLLSMYANMFNLCSSH